MGETLERTPLILSGHSVRSLAWFLAEIEIEASPRDPMKSQLEFSLDLAGTPTDLTRESTNEGLHFDWNERGADMVCE
jgi:hypothetical protein